MSRLSTPALESASGLTAEIYAQIKKAIGTIPNAYAAIGAFGPAALKAILQADGVLAGSTLSNQDRETIKLVVSESAGCDYCVAAHSMLAKMTGLPPNVLAAIRAGQPTGDPKRDALVRLVRKLTRTRGTISEEEFSAIRAAGYSNQQLVEISLAIALTTFSNVFNRINDTDIDFPAVE